MERIRTTLGEILEGIRVGKLDPGARRMNFAIVGLGRHAEAHSRFYKKFGHNVVAIAEESRQTVREKEEYIEGELEVKPENVFTGADGYERLLDLGLDGVSICTPPFARRDIVSDLLEGGLNVLVETPLASSVEDAQHIVSSLGDNVAVMGYVWNHAYPIEKLRGAVRARSWGRLKEARFDQRYGTDDYSDPKKWKGNPKIGGGHILDHMIHQINYLSSIFGPVESVEAEGELSQQNPSLYGVVRVRFEFPHYTVDAVSVLDERIKRKPDSPKHELNIKCVFEEGDFDSSIVKPRNVGFYLFEVHFNGEECVKYKEMHGSDRGASPKEIYEPQGLWGTIFAKNAVRNFIEAVQGKAEPYPSLKQGYQDLKVAFAIRESIASGKKVDIKY
jgi:predicted dehydrogenase